MTKRVIVIASGETERRAIPHLVAHLQDRGIVIDGVRIPPRQQPLDIGTTEKLVKAARYENLPTPPDKFVILVDVDRADPQVATAPFRECISRQLRDIAAPIKIAWAQQHLESWYFADSRNLRNCLGRALGNIDASIPDLIDNPKLHLKNLLGSRVYTARVSEDIARALDAGTAAGRSPSFRGFLDAAIDGDGRTCPA